MRAMLSRLRVRDAALFVVIAGLVAAGVFAAAREAGVGERADAGTQAAAAEQRVSAPQQSGEGTPPAPLALTLSAPTICETLPAQEYAGRAIVSGRGRELARRADFKRLDGGERGARDLDSERRRGALHAADRR